jgi:ADP-heptose:LPS heptosyltransferase
MKTFSGKIADAGTGNSLRTFFALVNLADVHFTPDSLALHAATALEKAVVVYTGPTSYTELSVFGKGAVIHSDLDCLVCYLNVCDKKINCMNSLSIDMVYAALAKYF